MKTKERRKGAPVVSVNPVPLEIQDLITEIFDSQNAVAEVLGVDRSSVSRWVREKEIPDPVNEERIAGLRYVSTRLLKIFTKEGARAWLLGINAHLNNQRPLDLLRNGRLTEVISALEQAETGSYA